MGQLKDTTFQEIAPRQSLRDYVDGIWYSHSTVPHTLYILPTIRSTLMTCHTPYGKGVVLVGALSTMQVVELESGDMKVGAWLKPGSRYTFAPHELTELRDQVIFGCNMDPLVRKFETTIETFDTPQEKLECFQNFIELLVQEKKIMRHPAVDRFISAAEAANGQATVKNIAHDSSVGYRQLNRLVKSYTGFTPKEFLKLLRFNAAAHALDKTGDSISSVAVDYDYADHPHFAREFRARTNLTPSMFDKYQAL